MQFRARITRTTGLSVIMTALTYNPRLYNKLKGNCSSHRPKEVVVFLHYKDKITSDIEKLIKNTPQSNR